MLYAAWAGHKGGVPTFVTSPAASAAIAPAIDPSTQSAFTNIYVTGQWGPGGNGSGDGSTLPHTSRTRAMVELMVYKFDLHAMVDAPCGGMTWMPLVLERIWATRPSFQYHGVDIVESVIQKNQGIWHEMPKMEFSTLDFCKQPIPLTHSPRASAIFSRDALQHLPLHVIVDALENFAASAATYLIVGSYTGGPNNDINVGEYFSIDLLLPPFNLPPPVDFMAEETTDGKNFAVFKIADLHKVDFAAMRARVAEMPAAEPPKRRL